MKADQGLLVAIDDDFVDLELVKRAVEKHKLNFDVLTCGDGASAIELLCDLVEKRQASRLVVLLDINMPGVNGHQFLNKVREHEKLRGIVVFVLTSSDHPRDVFKAYQRNVAGYFTKSNLDGLMETLATYTLCNRFPTL